MVRRFDKRAYMRRNVLQTSAMNQAQKMALGRLVIQSRLKGTPTRLVRWANGELGIYSPPTYNKTLPNKENDMQEWIRDLIEYEHYPEGSAPPIPASLVPKRQDRIRQRRPTNERKAKARGGLGKAVIVKRDDYSAINHDGVGRPAGALLVSGDQFAKGWKIWGEPSEFSENGSGSSAMGVMNDGESSVIAALYSTLVDEDGDETAFDLPEGFDPSSWIGTPITGIWQSTSVDPSYERPISHFESFIIRDAGDINQYGLETGQDGEPSEDEGLSHDTYSEAFGYHGVVEAFSTGYNEKEAIEAMATWKENPEKPPTPFEVAQFNWIKRQYPFSTMGSPVVDNFGRTSNTDYPDWAIQLTKSIERAGALSRQYPNRLFALGTHQVFFDKGGGTIGYYTGSSTNDGIYDGRDNLTIANFYGGKMLDDYELNIAHALARWVDIETKGDYNKRRDTDAFLTFFTQGGHLENQNAYLEEWQNEKRENPIGLNPRTTKIVSNSQENADWKHYRLAWSPLFSDLNGIVEDKSQKWEKARTRWLKQANKLSSYWQADTKIDKEEMAKARIARINQEFDAYTSDYQRAREWRLAPTTYTTPPDPFHGSTNLMGAGER